MVDINLTQQQKQVLNQNHGFVQGPSYVLMSNDAYRHMMGVGTDEELSESLKAIEEGLADVAAGRTRPFREVLNEIGQNDGPSR